MPTSAPTSPAWRAGGLGAGRRPGRVVALALARRAGGECRQHHPLQLGAVGGTAHDRCCAVGASRREASRAPAGGVDLQRRGAEPVPAVGRGAGQPGRDRLEVAAEGHRRVGGDLPGHCHGHRARPAARAAARRRPARPQWSPGGQQCGGGGHRPGRRRTRPARTARRPGWPRSSSATTGRTHTPPTTPPRPCGCRGVAGTAARRRRNTWPPGRSSAARRGCPARSPSPAGRCARSAACRRGGAPRRPSPRSGAAGPAIRHAPRAPGMSAARCRPTARPAARTSPAASPHPAGARSRSSPARTPRRRPRSAGAARPAAAGGRS